MELTLLIIAGSACAISIAGLAYTWQTNHMVRRYMHDRVTRISQTIFFSTVLFTGLSIGYFVVQSSQG